MPIRFKKEKCIYSLEQEIIRPSVYFDTWVLNKIIRDGKVREQISVLFNDDFGTLCLSDTNIVEIVSRGEKEICEIADFICHIPFIIFDDNPLTLSIFKPLDIFHEFGVIDCIDQPIDFKKILLTLKVDPGGIFKQSQDVFIEWVNKIRESKNEGKKMIKVYNKLKNKQNPTPKEVADSWVGYVCNKIHMKINNHDSRDLYHLCKPLVHCDIVSMDGRWKSFIDETFPALSGKIIADKGGEGIQLLLDIIQNYKHV